MNILFITQLFPEKDEGCYTSGALREFIEEWGKTGHKIKVIRPHFNYEKDPFPTTPKFNIGNNIDIEFVKPLRIPILKLSYYDSKKIINRLPFKPDIVICHLYNAYFTFHNLAKKLDIPFVIGIHMSDMKLSQIKFHKWHQKTIFKKASGFACRSYAYKKIFDANFPEFKSKSFLAISGIPETFLIPKFSNQDQRKKNKNTSIITVSSLIKRKQIDLVINSLSKVKNQDWHFTIIGTGPELPYLESLVKNYDLDNKVTFTGKLPRTIVIESLLQSDIFILPSYDETLGLVYLEAMACGNITIGSINEGIDGIITDGENGFLCDASDKENIYQKLKQVLNLRNDEINAIRINAKETVKNYTISNQAKKYLENLNQIINNDHNKA
ncbi:glycosyltransferase family 4 protein [Saccharicrinis sp. FJH2]|uniref:glycosyltransferase family 4 protein n=1 Tax=Saccharicrinis sp. FJH65 TaxID=3344659 RepID=UPI0035F23315